MAGELAAAAQGMTAPSVGGSVAGDIAGAIAGVVKGQREEEERQRKAALDDAMLSMKQRELEISEGQLEVNARGAEAQMMQAEAMKADVEIRSRARWDTINEQKRIRESKDEEANVLREELIRVGYKPEAILRQANTDAVLRFYSDYQKLLSDQREIEKSIKMGAQQAAIGALGQATSAAGQMYSTAAASEQLLQSRWQSILDASGEDGFVTLQNPETGLNETVYFLDVPLDVRAELFQNLTKFVDEMGPEGAGLIAQLQRAKADTQRAKQMWEEQLGVQNRLLNSVGLATLQTMADQGQLDPGAVPYIMGPFMQGSPDVIQGVNGVIQMPPDADPWAIDGPALTGWSRLVKSGQSSAAATIMMSNIQRMGGPAGPRGPEVQRIMGNFEAVLAADGMDLQTLLNDAEREQTLTGLAAQYDPSNILDKALKTPPSGPGQLVPQKSTGEKLGSAFGVTKIKGYLKAKDYAAAVQAARESGLTVQYLLRQVETKEEMEAILDRWPARVGN